MMGVEPEKTIYDLVMTTGELDPEKLAGYVISHPSGVDVVPAPVRPEDAELVAEDRVARLLDVAKETYDAIVVDTPAFFQATTLATLDRTDRLLLVTTLDIPAVKNVKLTLADAQPPALPQGAHPPRDQPRHVKAELDRKEVEKALDLKVSFELPGRPRGRRGRQPRRAGADVGAALRGRQGDVGDGETLLRGQARAVPTSTGKSERRDVGPPVRHEAAEGGLSVSLQSRLQSGRAGRAAAVPRRCRTSGAELPPTGSSTRSPSSRRASTTRSSRASGRACSQRQRRRPRAGRARGRVRVARRSRSTRRR